MSNHYHKDIDCNGQVIYYKMNRRRFVRASRKKAELEIQTGAATVETYVPIKPNNELTDRQLLAKIEWNEENDCVSESSVKEAEARGLLA